jgi:hypothetical protein
MRLWGQDEHATSFVLRVLDHLINNGHCPKDCSIYKALDEVCQRLCVLQCLFLRNGAWVEQGKCQDELRDALLTVMGEIQRCR